MGFCMSGQKKEAKRVQKVRKWVLQSERPRCQIQEASSTQSMITAIAQYRRVVCKIDAVSLPLQEAELTGMWRRNGMRLKIACKCT